MNTGVNTIKNNTGKNACATRVAQAFLPVLFLER